ncbi:hypothetical protein HPB48_005547 [Haemaphysalis longicornis]|uniref:Uncharacterized protein n=1 Tax=Haemaphysalis longicornis TaxID=44386 RepID=A0A9J6GCT7_HAELO|nr:hypothetical protein HPB48_005547 [Haemaphysalis longicornis]
MKQVALMSSEKPASAVAQGLQGLGEKEKMAMISEDSLKKVIRKQRCAAYAVTPRSFRGLIVSTLWSMTGGPSPEKFLFYDNERDPDLRLLVFVTASYLRLLCERRTWIIYGNFDQAPKGFLQLYAIRVPLGKCSVSVV